MKRLLSGLIGIGVFAGWVTAQISGGPISGLLTAQSISSLSAGSDLGGTELIPMVQSGNAVTTTPSAIGTYIGTLSGINATKVNGASVPTSSNLIATNASSQLVAATTSTGGLQYGSGSNAWSNLGGNTTVQPQVLCQTGTGSVSAAPGWCNYQATLIQTGIPFGMPANGYMDTAGNFVIGAAPASSATAVLSQTSGTAYVTFSVASMAGTSAGDVGRVLTVQEGAGPFTYNSYTVTTFLSTTAAQGTISGSGTLPANSGTVTGVAITSTSGAFSCTCTNLIVGQGMTLSGTYGGTGSITGYSNPTTYYVSATNGTSTFTLQSAPGTAIVTTTGTPTGITYTVNGTASLANNKLYLTSGWPGAVATGGGTTFPAPLTFTYPSAYLYFPASSPTGVAGLFYCTTYSQGAGTCYNNTVSSGTPTIPGSPTAFSGLTAGTYTQTTGATNLLTYTIPGNTLGNNGCLDVDFSYSTDNSGNNKTASFKHAAGAAGTGTASTTQTVGRTVEKLCNNGSESAQTSEAFVTSGTAVTAQASSSSSTVAHYTIAMGSNQVSAFLSNLANSTDTIFFEMASLKVTSN